MSDFHIQAVTLTNVEKHPNADTLSLGDANGHPVIFRTGEYAEGEEVVHIPVDAIVPETPEWDFLGSSRRIKAKRLRGVFSMGMITRKPEGTALGDDCRDILGITKYEPELAFERGRGGKGGAIVSSDAEPDPGFLPEYTDIESYRRNKDILVEGEPVTLTEKLHGCAFRALYRGGRLWVGSRHRIVRPPGEPETKYRGNWDLIGPQSGETGIATTRHQTRPFDNEAEAQAELDQLASHDRIPAGITTAVETRKVSTWWQVALDLDLETKLARHPNIAIYGEAYGQVQDLKYGKKGVDLALYDAMDTNTLMYLDRDSFVALAADLELPTVPTLYEGPWSVDLLALAEGASTIEGVDCIREGFVVKPTVERYERSIGRCVLKVVGETYLCRKGG